MGCRGGELIPEEVEEVENNEALCNHIKKNWKHYTTWANKATSFCVHDGKESFHKKYVLSIFEKAIVATSLDTGLSKDVQKSKIKKDKFVYLVARTVFKSSEPCSEATMELLVKCRKNKP